MVVICKLFFRDSLSGKQTITGGSRHCERSEVIYACMLIIYRADCFIAFINSGIKELRAGDSQRRQRRFATPATICKGVSNDLAMSASS